jgi:hypothetical protein
VVEGAAGTALIEEKDIYIMGLLFSFRYFFSDDSEQKVNKVEFESTFWG